MISFSVVAANIPLALALEPGQNARASLGIVVIGGPPAAPVPAGRFRGAVAGLRRSGF